MQSTKVFIYFVHIDSKTLDRKRQIMVAKKFGAYAVSHGATGKGNDQIRFELGYSYFAKKLK